jgi:uncharacterized protein (DUF2141 family)
MRSLLLLAGLLLPAAAAPEGTLTVHLTHLHSAQGAVMCRLYDAPEGFPGKPPFRAQMRVAIEGQAATCTFPHLPPGTYAVAAFHDENDNGKLDTNFLGIPKEGVGVSNNAKGVLGPPKWEQARFDLSGDLTIEISMVY